MVNRYEITKEQALFAVSNGEFGSDVTASGDSVIVIMTQDWCPQWHDMKSWIFDLKTAGDIDVHVLIYNKTDYFNEFVQFKENVLKNDLIPYLRYYKSGRLVHQSNYVHEQRLRSFLEI